MTLIRFSYLATLCLLGVGGPSVVDGTLLLPSSAPPRRSLDVVAEWRTVDFQFPNRVVRDAAIVGGDFIPENVVVLDVDSYGEGKKQRIFVTTPRLRAGVPATLSELSLEESSESPKLRPFPSWEWNDVNDCDNLISVFRTTTDQCGRLWVLDSGTVNVFSTPDRTCPPKLVVFDLRDGTELVTRYTFPSAQREPSTLLITVAVDVREGRGGADGCRDAFAYVADVSEPALLVYDMRRNRSWRVQSNLLYPYPLHGSFKINGTQFDLMDGVFGLALSPWPSPTAGPTASGDRTLFFHSLASVRESWVSCRALRNESNASNANKQFLVSEPRRTSQSAAEAMDANGVLFFGLLSENALACWNSRLPYTPRNILTVARNDETMQFASGLKVIGRHVWMLSSRFQNVATDRVNPQEVNYRVLVAPIAELVRGTSCAVPGGPLDNLVDTGDAHHHGHRPASHGGYGAPTPSHGYGAPGPRGPHGAHSPHPTSDFGFPFTDPSFTPTVDRQQQQQASTDSIVFRDPVDSF